MEETIYKTVFGVLTAMAVTYTVWIGSGIVANYKSMDCVENKAEVIADAGVDDCNIETIIKDYCNRCECKGGQE